MASKAIADALDSESAKERMKVLTVRIEDELESLIKMFSHARASLENELLSGMGYKQLTLSEKDAKKLKEFTVGMNSLVETRIKWDKAKKQMAAHMTPAEEMDAVFQYIMALDDHARNGLRDRLSHNGVFKWKS